MFSLFIFLIVPKVRLYLQIIGHQVQWDTNNCKEKWRPAFRTRVYFFSSRIVFVLYPILVFSFSLYIVVRWIQRLGSEKYKKRTVVREEMKLFSHTVQTWTKKKVPVFCQRYEYQNFRGVTQKRIWTLNSPLLPRSVCLLFPPFITQVLRHSCETGLSWRVIYTSDGGQRCVFAVPAVWGLHQDTQPLLTPPGVPPTMTCCDRDRTRHGVYDKVSQYIYFTPCVIIC